MAVRRSVLEEHAARRERQRKAAEYISPEGHVVRAAPMGSAVPPPDAETSRLKKETAALKKKIAERELEKLGPAGDRLRKIAKAKEARERDLEIKEAKRQSQKSQAHLASIARDGEKSRKLAKNHHKEHMEELKKDRKERDNFFKKGPIGKILMVLGGLVSAFVMYRKIKAAVWVARKLAPIARVGTRLVRAGVRSGVRRIVRAAPGVGRAAQKARIAAKRALRKLPQPARRFVRNSGANLRRVGGIARAGLSRFASGSAMGGIRSLAGAFLGGKVTGAVAPLAAGGYAAVKGADNVGTLFDPKKGTFEKIQAGAKLATSGAGAVIGGSLGGVKGAAYGAAAGNALADGAEWVGNKTKDTWIMDKIADGIFKVMSPFSEEAQVALDRGKNGSPGLRKLSPEDKARVDAYDKQRALEKGNLNVKDRLEKENIKAMTAAVAPITESTRTFADKIKDWTDIASNAAGKMWGGIKNAASSAVGGVKDAASAVVKGYEKGGVMGAIKSAPDALATAGKGVLKAHGDLASGAMDAYKGVQYDLKKGSKSELELAMGFQGQKTVKGLNDSQTRALAGNTMKTESGGKLGIVNPYGYQGQYQMGADALVDNGIMDGDKLKAAKAASKKAGKDWFKDGGHKSFMEDNANYKNAGGREAFLSDKKLQDDLFVKYTNNNVEAGMRSGALNGKSTPAEIAAYAKASHLKGSGGANALILKGKDSTDANGTKVSTYASQAAASMTGLAAKVDAAKGPDGAKTAKVSQAEVKVAGSTPAPMIMPKKDLAAQVAEAKPAAVTMPMPGATPVLNAPEITSNGAAQSMPMPQAESRSQPAPMVAKNVPTEAQSAAMVAARANQQQQGQASSSKPPPSPSGGGGGSGQPTLDEMPIMLNDLGLVLLNIGHV